MNKLPRHIVEKINNLLEQGCSVRQVARLTGTSKNTVRKYAKEIKQDKNARYN